MAVESNEPGPHKLFAAWGYRWEKLNGYIVAPILRLTGPTTAPLRIYMALLSILTLFLTYLLGLKLFDRRTGLIATSLLSLLFWHIAYSRVFYRVNLVIPLSILSAIFLVRCLRDSKKSDWVLLAL